MFTDNTQFLPQPEVLLYNMKEDERFRTLTLYLKRSGIGFRRVTAPEFLHPLGYLFKMPGFSPNPQFNLGCNFKEEMIVLKDFSEEELDGFLAFFREKKLAPAALKAVLTPVTVTWNSLRLHDELMKEHEAMKKR